MKRRKLLSGFGAGLATASLGGCLSQYRDAVGDGGADAGDTTEEHPTDEKTTTDQRAMLADTSFEVLQSNCGSPTNEASVAFGEREVTVTGIIAGSNTCYTAKLADASYDPETQSLDLTVASMQKEGAEACAQCIVELEYEATATFEGGLPESVRVVHEGMDGTETVTTVTR